MLTGKWRDCGACRRTPGLQAQRACPDLPADRVTPASWCIDGDRLTVCPMGTLDRRRAAEAVSLHRHYRAGFLPGPGGVLDQRERDLEMIETIEAVASEIAAEKQAATP